MGARTDFEPLSWEEAEQNRRENAHREFASVSGDYFSTKTVIKSGLPPTVPANPLAVAPEGQASSESVLEQSDRLRSEIKRGKEYLAQVQKDLAEKRSLLEEWPTYEQNCGRNPLAHLTQCELVNERITQFLTGWLKRREAELEGLSRMNKRAA